MTIEEILRNFAFDGPDWDEAMDEAQAILDKGLTCDTCKYNQNDPTDGRPCACLSCALMHLTPEQQKNKINYEAC